MKIGGKTLPKWAPYAIAGAAVIAGVLYFRSKNSSPASGSNANATDPVTGLPYSMDSQIDPQTGLTYLAEAQTYGSVSAAESALAGTGAGAGAYGYGGGASGYGYGYPTSDITGSGYTTGTAYTTNAQWVQAATAGLTALGYNGSDVGAALGLYLLGMPLDSTQVKIVQTAVAEYGEPPVGSYAIIGSPNSQTGSTGSDSGGTTGTGSTGSTGTGSTAPKSWRYPAPGNLSAAGSGKGRIHVSWAAVTGPQGQRPSTYTVAYGRSSGAHTWENTVAGTSTTLDTQPGMTEFIEVWANGGPVAPPHAGPVKATAGK